MSGTEDGTSLILSSGSPHYHKTSVLPTDRRCDSQFVGNLVEISIDCSYATLANDSDFKISQTQSGLNPPMIITRSQQIICALLGGVLHVVKATFCGYENREEATTLSQALLCLAIRACADRSRTRTTPRLKHEYR